MTETKQAKKVSNKKKELVKEPLLQHIDFTEYLSKNPRMRPRKRKSVKKAS